MKIIGWIIATPFILLIFLILLRIITCGPDRAVVKVISPVAKIIADDILKNGIPKSLKDIKGLPYELEGCIRQEEYLGKDRKPISKKKAYYMIINDKCYFEKDENKYSIEYLFSSNYDNRLTIFNQETRTGISYFFEYSKEKGKLILEKDSFDNPFVYDHKSTGICHTIKF